MYDRVGLQVRAAFEDKSGFGWILKMDPVLTVIPCNMLSFLFQPQGLREGGQGGDMPDIFEHLFGGGGGGMGGGMGGFFGMPFGGMGGGMGGMGLAGMGGRGGGRRRAAKGEDTLHPLK